MYIHIFHSIQLSRMYYSQYSAISHLAPVTVVADWLTKYICIYSYWHKQIHISTYICISSGIINFYNHYSSLIW